MESDVLITGVFIPNMKMPSNCAVCGVRQEAGCKVDYMWLIEHPDYYDIRKPDCPLSLCCSMKVEEK